MSVVLTGQAPASFEIKSANLPLVSLLLKLPDLEQLQTELDARFGDIPDFFDQDPLLVDLSPLQAAHEKARVDFKALITMLRQRKLSPIAVCGGSSGQMVAAVKAGLVAVHEPVLPRQRAPQAAQSDTKNTQIQADANSPAAHVAHEHPSALVVDHPVRSGQQIYARGRDLVVLAMVNPGAEVIADGHIHIYAPLRGRAMAGARGDTSARIFALDMQPELISIAGVYRTAETPLSPEVWRHPAQIHLSSGKEGDKLIITAL